MRRSGSFWAFSAPGFAEASSGASALTMPMKSLVLKRVATTSAAQPTFRQRIFEFMQPIGGIDGDEDEPGFGRGELGQRPFRPVERPDADAFAPLQPEREQAGGEIAHAGPQLLPGPSDAMTGRYQRRPLGPTCRGARQRLPDRHAQQRFRADAADIAERRCRHELLPLRPGFAAGTLRNSLAHVKRTATGIPLPALTGVGRVPLPETSKTTTESPTPGLCS